MVHSIHDLIKTKENEALKRHDKTCEEIQVMDIPFFFLIKKYCFFRKSTTS